MDENFGRFAFGLLYKFGIGIAKPESLQFNKTSCLIKLPSFAKQNSLLVHCAFRLGINLKFWVYVSETPSFRGRKLEGLGVHLGFIYNFEINLAKRHNFARQKLEGLGVHLGLIQNFGFMLAKWQPMSFCGGFALYWFCKFGINLRKRIVRVRLCALFFDL
ncbi:MAG: hypothetical protein GX297_02150 [Treponema sp.]|nr:hypothetical protein [Treponema sp.]